MVYPFRAASRSYGDYVTNPDQVTAGSDAAAVQVVDLVMKAAELLSGQIGPDDVVDELAQALRVTRGIHAVIRKPRTVASILDESRALPDQFASGAVRPADRRRRPRHLLGASARGMVSDLLVVELACPGDEEWVSPDHLRRLTSAIMVIESAITKAVGKYADGPSEWMLRHVRSVVVQLMPDSWAVRSDAMTQVLGYPRGYLPSGGPLSLVDERDRTAALRAYVEVLTGRRFDRTLDLRVRAADGPYRVLETTYVNLVSAPSVHSVVLYGTDVTEQRAERARLRELVMRLAGAVLVIDEGGRVRLANDAFTRLFGTRAGGWIAAHQREALRAVMAMCLDGAATGRRLAALTTARKRRSVRLALTDGRTVDLDRVPLRDTGIDLGSLWHFRDVTTESGAGAAAGLTEPHRQSILDEQNRVLATVSHELRTPLTAVLSFAELLDDPLMGPLNDQQRSACDVIARNTRRLLTLVDDLLLLSRLERGQLPLRLDSVDMVQLVANAVDDRRLEAGELGIKLVYRAGDGPELIGDANRLQQVVDNVVRNALKFSPAGSAVRVVASHKEGQWTVEVSDSGIGIPRQDLAQITRGFTRGSNAVSAGIPGSGIGLAVCRELVELHGGTLDIHSVVDVGTTVRVNLPERGTR